MGENNDQSRGSLSRRTRSQAAPEWTVNSCLILVNEIAVVEGDCQNALSSFQKWKIISENCSALDVTRNVNQCRRKWNSLLSEYKKIGQWKPQTGFSSYWSLESEKRKEFGLPEHFDNELYAAIDNLVRARDDQLGSESDGDAEGELDPIDFIGESGSKRGKRPLIHPKGCQREKSKRVAMEESADITLAELKVQKRNIKKPDGKSIEGKKHANHTKEKPNCSYLEAWPHKEEVQGDCVKVRTQNEWVKEDCVVVQTQNEVIKGYCVGAGPQIERIQEGCVEVWSQNEEVQGDCVEMGPQDERVQRDCEEAGPQDQGVQVDCVVPGSQNERAQVDCVEAGPQNEGVQGDSAEVEIQNEGVQVDCVDSGPQNERVQEDSAEVGPQNEGIQGDCVEVGPQNEGVQGDCVAAGPQYERVQEDCVKVGPQNQSVQVQLTGKKEDIFMEDKEQGMKAKLHKSAEMIHAIVNQNLPERGDDSMNDIRSVFIRRQGDKLISCLEDIVNTLCQLDDLVQDCE